MDEGAAGEAVPDLRDIEAKIGRKTPEGLLRCLREEASSLRGDAKLAAAHDSGAKETGRKSLDEKIRKLKMEMAHLRSVDVKLLQQLLAVHEGIEAVKWLLEERSTMTSRCSSLTGSQYSLGEGPDTSWRGSWSSLQDPNDKLDNISIGSYLDTLADDMDEYCPSSSESVICSATPLVSEAAPGGRTGGGLGAPVTASEGPKQDAPVWTKAAETGKGIPVKKDNIKAQSIKVNGIHEKPSAQTGSPTHPSLTERQGTSQSPKLKPYRNGKIELESCKMNGKMHMEYDAHWRWVQSQEDVTFL
ncbi:leucine rich adaptor protein 1 [Pleuronectes platessa]|uniref:leucine rich adaptor protein 1 n=1 Tax=Pleuronectes platessa TaxID=8262 RepID=UPI00232A49B8|nr:leucine rich adaptor protein 1 [Pleuronectes platessa]